MSKRKTIPKTLPNSISKKEGNKYDKIFKENLDSIFFVIIGLRLGIPKEAFVPIKEKHQSTVEREVDSLFEVNHESQGKFLVNMEFESGDNPNMIYRVTEWNGIILNKHKLPVKHFVVYLGESPAKMKTRLEYEGFMIEFELIELRNFDTGKLLSSQVPEEVLLAVLANYPKENAESILRLIRQKIVSLCKTASARNKYFAQLLVLSQLRKIDLLTEQILSDMPVTIDLRENVLFKNGLKEGMEKKAAEKERLFVIKLLSKTQFDVETIADLAGVDIELVKKIKKELSKEL